MKKFLKVLTTLLFGVLLLSACALIEPMHGGSDIYPVAFNHGLNGECYWISGGDLNRIHCPRVRQYSPFGIVTPFWWNAGPMYNRYSYYRPYYIPQYIPRTRNEPPRRDGNGVVTKDGYKETPSEPPKRRAKPRTGGRRGGSFSDEEVPLRERMRGRGGRSFSDEEVPLRERMPWLWPSCDPNCGQPSQPLNFELFKFDELERFEQFKLEGLEKYNEVLRYNHTRIVEK